MRKLATLTFLTLDGVMQAPSSPQEDPSNEFSDGGWAANYWNDVMGQVMAEAMKDPYDLLLGRKTYETFASHWPHAEESPLAKLLNQSRKYVVTSSLGQLDWNNSLPVSGDVPTEIARLKKTDGPLLQVHGSWQLIQTLLRHDLIDELRIWTFPLLVGKGKRLFEQELSMTEWKLIKTGSTSSGVLMSFYSKNAPQSFRRTV